MKVKKDPLFFWAHILGVIPFELFWICAIYYTGYISHDNQWWLLLLFLIPLFWCFPFRSKDFLSIVTVSEKGVKAALFGRTWFEGTWPELTHIGEYVLATPRGGETFCIYFSKEPIESFSSRFPWCSQRDEDAVFVDFYSQKSLNRMHSYINNFVNEASIKNHGRFRAKTY